MRRTPPRAYSVADDSTDADLFDDILLGVDRSIASSEGDSNDDDDDNDDVIDGDDSDVTAEDRDPYADDSDAPGSGDDSDPFSAAFGDVVFDLANVLHADLRAIGFRSEHDVSDIFCRGEAAIGADRKLTSTRGHATTGQVDAFHAQDLAHAAHRHPDALQLALLQSDANLSLLTALEDHRADALR